MSRPRVLITLREGGQNGGPFVSHTRILTSELSEKYEFVPLVVPVPAKLRRWPEMRRFARSIRDQQPDIVHYAGLQLEGFFVSIALRLARVRHSVLAVHGSSSEAIYFPRHKKLTMSVLEALTLRSATVCYGVSDYVAGWRSVRRWARHCYGRIYNLHEGGVPVAEHRLRVRRELGIPDDAIVLVSTGRVIRDKGFDLIPELIALLGATENVWLVVAGDGDYRECLSAALADGPLADRSLCLGYRDDVKALLAAADIFVLMTMHETLGNSILEAGAQGLPSVVTAVGGVPEIIDHGINGFLFEPGDTVAAAEAVNALVASAALRGTMGAAARRVVDDKFNEARILEEIDALYDRLLNGCWD